MIEKLLRIGDLVKLDTRESTTNEEYGVGIIFDMWKKHNYKEVDNYITYKVYWSGVKRVVNHYSDDDYDFSGITPFALMKT